MSMTRYVLPKQDQRNERHVVKVRSEVEILCFDSYDNVQGLIFMKVRA